MFFTKKRVALFALLALHLQAAALNLSGTVVDESGAPLPGATVLVKGTHEGAAANADGRFELRTSATLPLTLAVNFLGYKEREVVVRDASAPVQVALQEESTTLNDVVVVGYGTQRRKELTGAIASISQATLKQPTMSVDQLLGGAVAGMSVTQASGQPGAGASVRIRGGNSVNASNDPLYVIDGFLFYGSSGASSAGIAGIESTLSPLSALNPADIASVEVLKDVSATAIYGSRGANGVIIVTTKKGRRDGSAVSYRFSTGWEQLSRKLPLMNATEWMGFQNELGFHGFSAEEIGAAGAGADWQSEVFRTGSSQTHELSVSGGSDSSRYLISGSYTGQDGIMVNSSFERFSARVNLENDLLKRLTVGLVATAGKSTQNSLTTFENSEFKNDSPYAHGIANSLTYALYVPPVVPIYNADGSYNYHNPYEYSDLSLGDITANPVADLNTSVGQSIGTSLLGNAYVHFRILPELVAKANVGANISHVTQNFFAPSKTALGLITSGMGGIGNRQNETWQMEYTLSYARRFSEAHSLDVLAGYTYQHTAAHYVTSTTSHFTNETLTFNNLADGATPYPPVSGSSESNLHSALGRLNYSLLGRYNLTATLRGDRSSRFAAQHRWGVFPSAGLSWNVNEEAFYPSSKGSPFIPSTLKLRLTAGTVDNQEIDDYDYALSYAAAIYNGGTAYRKSNAGNAALKWESTTQYNAGADMEFMGKRLNIVADVYYKKTYDLLLEAPSGIGSGLTSQLKNVGHVSNRGFELSATALLASGSDFSCTLSANFARNLNTIDDMGETRELLIGSKGIQAEILRVGESLGSFYGLIFDGVVQTGDDLSQLPVLSWVGSASQPGDPKFVDAYPDGVIDDKDRVVLGSIQPSFTYGLSATLSYRSFDLFVSVQGSYGNKLYNHLNRFLELPRSSYNASALLNDRWTPTNPSNRVPNVSRTYATNNSYLDSRYVEDASYLRLKNITLGYTLPLHFRLGHAAPKVKVFASAQNLFTLTSYLGYDPEVSAGTDLGAYPRSRAVLVGVELGF
ncbi:MAG: TonB-dependent receptor [Prevotellaceae bacterium]|jgi:TonB-linked SusC/RagA family outer membrane protein|nr:TonB-dependent receptor [Prevotellaceae bacterium]